MTAIVNPCGADNGKTVFVTIGFNSWLLSNISLVVLSQRRVP
jgi:hypothetical protein